MMVLKLEKEYDFFHLLFVVHITLILTELVMLVLQRNCSAVYSGYFSKVYILICHQLLHISLNCFDISNIICQIYKAP